MKACEPLERAVTQSALYASSLTCSPQFVSGPRSAGAAVMEMWVDREQMVDEV